MASQLFNIRCDNCGSEYRITTRGEMNCPFCGSKIYLNDKDFEAFKKARDEMLLKDRADNDAASYEGDVWRKWNNELQIFFETDSGKSINCKYFYEYAAKRKTIYVGSHHISILYHSHNPVDRIVNNINSINYPTADIKKLARFVPNIVLTANLKDGNSLLVLSKPENVYPLAMVDNLDPKQVAWMISRMENLGCLLNFNEKDFDQLVLTDFYFNPKMHDLYLLDGWEYLEDNPAPLGYLTECRTIAKGIMNTGAAPKECMEFLETPSALTAYDDFEKWEWVLNNGFNGHHFHHFPGLVY